MDIKTKARALIAFAKASAQKVGDYLTQPTVWADEAVLRRLADAHRTGQTHWEVAGHIADAFDKIDAANAKLAIKGGAVVPYKMEMVERDARNLTAMLDAGAHLKTAEAKLREPYLEGCVRLRRGKTASMFFDSRQAISPVACIFIDFSRKPFDADLAMKQIDNPGSNLHLYYWPSP